MTQRTSVLSHWALVHSRNLDTPIYRRHGATLILHPLHLTLTQRTPQQHGGSWLNSHKLIYFWFWNRGGKYDCQNLTRYTIITLSRTIQLCKINFMHITNTTACGLALLQKLVNMIPRLSHVNSRPNELLGYQWCVFSTKRGASHCAQVIQTE